MTPGTLVATPLAQSGFAAFGEVIGYEEAHARPANEGFARRCDLPLPVLETGTELAVYRVFPRPAPLRLDLFERHPHAAQFFVALTVERYLVVVAEAGPDERPDPGRARAFVGLRGTGFRYRPGVWHAPIMALGRAGDMLMFMARADAAPDTVEHRLAAPITVLA